MTAANDERNPFAFPQPTTNVFPGFTPPNLKPPMPSPFPGLEPQPSPVLPAFPMVYGQKLPQPLGNVGSASSAVIVNGAMLKCDKAKDAAARVKLVVDDKGYETGLGHKAMDTDTKPENFEGDFGTCNTDDEPCEMLQMVDKWTEVDESQTVYYNGQTMMGLTIDSMLVCTKGGGSLSIEENGQGWQATNQSMHTNSNKNMWEGFLARVGGGILGKYGDAYLDLDLFKAKVNADFKFLNKSFSELFNFEGKESITDLKTGEKTEKDLEKKSEGFDILRFGVGGEVSAVDLNGGGEVGSRLLGAEGSVSGKIVTAKAELGAAIGADKDGADFYVSGSAIASFYEADGTVSIKILGVEIGITIEGFAGGVGVIGEAGIKDNKLHAKLGGALGYGGTLGIDIGLAN